MRIASACGATSPLHWRQHADGAAQAVVGRNAGGSGRAHDGPPDRRSARGFRSCPAPPAPRKCRATSVRPVSAARSGCATSPSFSARALGKGCAPPLRSPATVQSARPPPAARTELGQQRARRRRRAAPAALSSSVSGRSAHRKPAPSISSISVLARSFSRGMAASSLSAAGRRRAWPRARRRRRDGASSPRARPSRSASALSRDVVAVDALQLGEVEPRRRAADAAARSNHAIISSVEKISSSPWLQPSRDQIVAHRLRQVAHGAIGIDAERAVALGQLGAVRAVDQRDVRHHRHVPAERLVDLLLAARHW